MTVAFDGPSSSRRAPGHAIASAPAEIRDAQWSEVREEDVDYLSAVRRLWSRKPLILLVCAIVTAASAAVVSVLPRHYVTDALVVVGNPYGTSVSAFSVGGTGQAITAPDDEAVQTEIQILQSPTLVAQTIRNLDLEDRKEFNPEARSPPARLSPDETAQQFTHTIENFLARLHVDVKGSSRVIDVSFDSRDPQLAAKIVNAIVDQDVTNQQVARADSVSQQAKWLQARIADLQQQSAKDEQAIAKFQAQAGLYSLPGGGPLLLKEMSDASDQLAQAQATRSTLQDRLRQLQIAMATSMASTSDLLGSDVMRTLRTQEATLQADIAHDSLTYGAEYPALLAKEVQLNDIREEMRSEARQVASALANDVQVALMREQQLTDRLNGLKQDVVKMNGADITLAGFQRQADADRLVLNNYLARFKEIDLQADEDTQRPASEIVSYAQVPITPTKPKPALLISIAALCSLVGTCGFLLFRDKTDPSFRGARDLEKATGIATLGLVPLAGRKIRSPIGILRYGAGSSYREAIKAIYMHHFVLFGKRSKTTLIASASAGEGKTMLVLSLAALSAQAGHKTLIIDADFWRAGASVALRVPARKPGLAEVLGKKASLQDVVVADRASGIDILPPGKLSPASSLALLGQFRSLLEELSGRYEFVIIDSPPVTAVSEALMLAAQADETILAVRWATTPRPAVILTLRRLREAGANVVGTVLTLVDERQHALHGDGDAPYFLKDSAGYRVAPDAALGRAPSGRDGATADSGEEAGNGHAETFGKISRLFGRPRKPLPGHGEISPYENPQWALLVLDMQEEFTRPLLWSASAERETSILIERVNELARRAEAAGIIVIYLQQEITHDEGTGFDQSRLPTFRKPRIRSTIDPRIQAVSAHSFARPSSDGLSAPGLETFLRERRVDHLFLTGMNPDTSIVETAKSALRRGHCVTFIRDGIGPGFDWKNVRNMEAFIAQDAFPISQDEFLHLLDRGSPARGGSPPANHAGSAFSLEDSMGP